MNEKFRKIKNKFLFAAIIKSVIAGLSAALFTVGAVLLSLTLAKVDFHAGWYALITFSLFILVCGATFLILRPTDKSVAKQLDKQFNLNERVQTMVEYSGKEGEMLDVQRADAVEKLSALPAGKFKIKDFLKFILVAVLSVALFVSAAVTNAVLNRDTEGGGKNELPPENGFTLTEWQILSVNELVGQIEKSDLSQNIKEANVTVINSLLDNLRQINTVAAMRAAVTSAIGMIDSSFENVTTFYVLGTAFRSTEGISAFTVALRESSRVYLTGVDLSEYVNVQQVAENIEDAVRSGAETRFSAMNEQIGALSGEELRERITKLSNDLSTALQSLEIDGNDRLYALFDGFGVSLAELAQNADDEAVKASLTQEFSDFTQEYAAVMTEQTYCRMLNEFIRNKLSSVFGVTVSALPALSLNNSGGDGSGGDGSGEDEDKTNPGGFGDGDKLYGSDDVIYDPYREEYVKYADVLNEYYARVTEQIRNGEISEELQVYVDAYFKLLFSGLENGGDKEET